MDQQQEELDPYEEWFDIPSELRPPTHYQLLGVDDFETDLELIAQAVKQRSGYLHQIAAGQHRKLVQQLMGEVAVARRTLLNAQSKQAYDNQLLADSEADAGHEQAGHFQVATQRETPATTDGSGDREPTQTRRRKKSTWDEYKLHAASASILLLIVGVVWFVNRGSGQRRAAEAGAASTAPAAPARDSTQRKSSAPAKLPVTKRSGVTRQRPTTASRSGRPSLAPDFDVNAFLDKDAPDMSQPNAARKNAARKNATGKSAAAGPSTNAKLSVPINLPADWEPGIEIADDFTKKLADRYQFDKKKTACKLDGQRVVIQQAGPSKYGNLRHKSLKLKPGQAVALETNLAPGLDSPVQIGLAIGDARIGLVANKDQLQVRAKNNQRKNNPSKSLGQLNTGSPSTTLIVMRSKEKPSRLHWIARNGESDLSGQIQVASLKGQPQLAIFFTAPEQPLAKPVWFDNLRFGKFSNAPEWKQSDVLDL